MKKTSDRVGLVWRTAFLVLCVALGAAPVVLRGQSASPSDGRAALDRPVVIVVPFSNISGETSDAWIGAGIADTVAADLGVLGLSSVVAEVVADDDERGGRADDGLGLADDVRAREAGQRHGAAWVVTGGFQRVGDQLRVIARLLDVESDDIRRTVTLDGTGEELFVLQDRVVAELTDGVDMTVARGEERRVAVEDEDVAERPAVSPEISPEVSTEVATEVSTDAPTDSETPTSGVTAVSRFTDAIARAGTIARLDPNDSPTDSPTAPVTAPLTAPGGPVGAIGNTAASTAFSGAGVPAAVAGTGAEFGILAGRPMVRPTRTEVRPNIDGRIDDEVWRTAAAITDFVQQAPLDGAPATEATEVRVAYDSQNIYLAFHVHYADAGIMRANRVDRDQANEDDLVTVYLDTFLDQQQAFVFDVNGYGVQGDGIINTSGGRGGGRGRRGGGGGGRRGPQAIPGPDRSWDALFDSAGQIVADGFTAEMAIPFKSLRYPQLGGATPHRWGFQVVRTTKGSNNESDVWSPMSRDVNGFLTQMGVLEGMTNLSTSRNLEFLPTFTGVQFGSLDATSGEFPEDFNGEGGLDVKYGITSNLTASFTFNPDFSQIESDIAQIDVNQRFPLFFPELRPFFLEGQEVFRLSSPVNWVNTRTVVDPRVGAKLTGKIGDLAIGLLAADDEAPGNIGDRSDPAFGQTAQVFVARARYDLYAESYMGGLVTDREFMGSYSRAMGIDGQFRIGQTARFNYMVFQTMNQDLNGVETSGPSWGLLLQRNGRNLRVSTFTGSNHPDAATDVGFLRRSNTQDFNQTVSYRWWPDSWIINWGPRVRYSRLYDYDWVLEDEGIDTGIDFTFARSISAGAGLERSLERFAGIDFWKTRYTGRADVATSRRISVGGDFSWGDQIFFGESPFLGRGVQAGANIFFRPIARLQSQINIDTSRLTDMRDGAVEVFDIKLFRALTTYQFTERLLLRNITDFNTFDDTVGVNFLVTYRINAGTVFFFGYDDRYQQFDRFEQMGDELLLRRDLQRTNRAVFTKLQYLFRL